MAKVATLAPPVAFEGSEMQRPTASCSTSMRQPWPAMATPPMMQSSGTNTSWPRIGPFWNGMLSGRWRAPISMPAVSRRHQRAGDAEVGGAAQQPLGIEHAERQPDHRRHRRQRDVALGEVEPQPQHLLALPLAAADHAGVGNGGGVRADARAGEGEARDFLAARQARQVVILLLLGAVVLQQLGRPQ